MNAAVAPIPPLRPESEGRPLRILIAGAGLSGLCLAQGLKKDGHEVYVFERDAEIVQRSGYMLSMNGDGGEALRRCLPADLFELYAETSTRTSQRRGTVVLDDQLNQLSAMPHLGITPNDGERPHSAVHRRTLRQILQARLDGVLFTGVEVAGYDERPDGVTLHFADGGSVDGDLLVGADGIKSAIRRQKLPDVEVIDAGIEGIGVYGRSPLPPEIAADIPEQLIDDVTIAADRSGHRLLLGPLRPRRSADAARELAPDVTLDTVEPYVMVSATVPADTPVPPNREWTADTPAQLRDAMLRGLDGWHPAARGIVERVDLDSLFMIPFGRLEPPAPWTPSRVTLVGDAAHAMLPTLGMGGNLALMDAGRLTEAITGAARSGGDLVAAIGQAEEQMREYVYPFMRMTVQHDENFGGGGLSRMARSEAAQS